MEHQLQLEAQRLREGGHEERAIGVQAALAIVGQLMKYPAARSITAEEVRKAAGELP